MTEKELMALCPGVPKWVTMTLLSEINCYQEVRDGAKRAVEDGVVGRWLPVGR